MMKMITKTNGLTNYSQLTKLMGVCCTFVMFLFMTVSVSAQCINTTPYGNINLANSNEAQIVAGCGWGGEYNTVSSIIADIDYIASSSTAEDYLTITQGTSDGTVIASGLSPLQFSVTSTDDLFIHVNTDEQCGTENVCRDIFIQALLPFDCEALEAFIGDTCDDLDENTINDVIGEDCLCAGSGTPSNDNCDAPLALECGIEATGDTYAASSSEGAIDPSCAGGSFQDVFYSFEALPGVTYTVAVNGDDFDGVLALYSGSCDALAELGCSDVGLNGGEESVEITVDEATSVLIQFYDWNSGGGSYAVNLTCVEGVDCDNLQANFGDVCDDLDDNTINDVVTEDCVCAGTPLPSNDNCDAPLALECGIEATGDTYTATSSEGAINPSCGNGSFQDVFYSFEALPGVTYTVAVNGDDFDGVLALYSGSCDALAELGCSDVGLNGGEESVEITVDEATSVLVQFYDWNTGGGSYAVNLTCVEGLDCDNLQANIGDSCDDQNDGTINDTVTEDCLCIGDAVPANDICENAPLLICGVSVEGSTAFASADPISADFCGTTSTAPGVWYNYYSTDAGLVSFDLTGSSYDTKLFVYQGLCGDLACVDGDDDGGAGTTSFVEFVSEDETYYYILVTGFGSNSGDYVLTVGCGFDCDILDLNIGDACDDQNDGTLNDIVTEDCECVGVPIPENDDCANAIALECGTVVPGTTISANPESQETCGTSNGSAGAVWYSYTPEANTLVTLGLCDADFDSKIRVFSGSCDTLVCVTGEDDDFTNCGGNDPIIDFAADAGVSYYILVHGFSSSEGNFDLSVDCTPIFDCEELEAYIGDACDDGDAMTENDIVDENCGCAGTPISTSDCEDWVMYLNNNADGVTDIYGVDISSGDAELAYITTVDYQAHIAFNPADNLIYVLHNGNGSYVTVNPHTAVPEVSAPVFLSQDIPSITAAAFAPNGKLLVGSATQNIIYSINTGDQIVSTFDAYAIINGGDIAFDATGVLYLATRAGNGLYKVYPDDVMPDQLIGTLPSLVTGMALTDSGKLLTAHNGNGSLQLRNLDGSDAEVSYALMLDGNAFDHNNGDMASGCNTFQNPNEGDCDAFSTFYSHFGNGTGVVGSEIYRVTYSGADANMELLTTIDFGAHIAYDGQNDIVYLVNPNGSFVRGYDPTLNIFLGDLPIVGDIDALFAVVFNQADGLLYVGDANDDEIYSIDLVSGIATFIGDAPVNGGDLAIQDGKVYLADRSNADLYEIVGGVAVLIGDMPAANGMAQANNATGLIVASPGSSDFIEINANDGLYVQTYTAMIEGNLLTLVDGDMAAGCSDDEPIIEIPNGDCNASEMINYTEGTTLGGGSLPLARTNSDQALGAPERTDAMVFTTLGYGGSMTVGFNGAVPNGAGDDIEVVETSFNNPGCDSYPEFADVSVSMDGIEWFSAGTVCKGEPFVDISDAGDFDYVLYVRVSNIDDQTTSGDGFDLDGIVALYNCEETPEVEGNNVAAVVGLSTISSFPNPTTGPSQVVFVTAETGLTLLEVYDMNGRNVSTLFNQVAQAGLENRVDFNGTSLPNGVYIYKLTTNNESIINKFMIAR